MDRSVHRFAVLLAAATFCLIIAGALVTSHDAGLATSDWPLSNGQVFPRMVGNLFWEHGHRIVAASVGLLTIAFVVYLHAREPRRWIRRLGLVALGAVIAQGLLGGLTVKLMLPLVVSAAHATLAQLFFLTTVGLAVFTSPGWREQRAGVTQEKGRFPLRYLSVAAFAAILGQLVLGAVLRHSAPWDKHLPASLLLAHVAGALIVALVLGSAVFAVLGRHRSETYLTRPAMLAGALLPLQLLMGVAAYVTREASPNDPQPLNLMIAVTVAHVACGALVFAATIVLSLRCLRILRSARPAFAFAAAA